MQLTLIPLAAAALSGCWTQTGPLADGFSMEADYHVAFYPELTVFAVWLAGPAGLVIPPLGPELTRTRLRLGETVLMTSHMPLPTPWQSPVQGPVSELTAGGREVARSRRWQWVGSPESQWHLLVGRASLEQPPDDQPSWSDGPWNIRSPVGRSVCLTPHASLPGGQPDSVLFALNIRERQYVRAVVYDSSHWRLEEIGPIQFVAVADHTHAHCTIRMRNTKSGKRMHVLVCCDHRQDVLACVYAEGDPAPDCEKARKESREP